jgi:hypothetical protein
MAAIDSIGAEIVDDDWSTRNTRLTAQRAMQLELFARLQTKVNVVMNRASGPGEVSYPSDSGEAHTSFVANHLEHRRDSCDARYQRYVMGYRLGRLRGSVWAGHKSSGQIDAFWH